MTNEELLAQAKELVEKSLISTTALATDGKLNPEQAERFIDYVIDVTMLSGNVRVVRFKPETMEINKIGVGQRVSIPASEASATSVRRGVSHSKVVLQPKEVMTPWELTTNYMEINLEGESVEDHIVRMMSTQTANDLEELFINGDLLGHARLESDLFDDPGASTTEYIRDNFIALFDGWLRKADSANIYDAGGANISSTVFSRTLLRLPIKFRRIRRDMRFMVSMDHEQLYLEKLSSRATAVGDAALQGQGGATVFGVPIVGVPLLEAEPLVVEHFTLGAAPDTANLRYAPIGTDVVVTDQTINESPVTPYTEGGAADYTVDRTAGTLTSVAGGAFNAGASIKVTYQSRGQMLFTNMMDLILAIGRDITIERARDIFKRTNQYAITTKVDVQIEELTALVKGINIGIN
jgi:hypothetical protein